MRRRALLAAAGGLAATLLATPAAATPAGSGANVFIVDNAFVRDVQRPVVRISAGATVTWHWRSRQSHSVLARSGPARFAAPTRNHGSFTHRFTRAGTYRIVCALHAPGMKMTVVVAR